MIIGNIKINCHVNRVHNLGYLIFPNNYDRGNTNNKYVTK